MSRRAKTSKAQRHSHTASDVAWTTGVCVGLVAITWIVFGQTLQFEFINVDDVRYVIKNPQVNSGLSAANVAWAFSRGYAWNWHPLTWISHMLDCQWHGLNPGGHHFTSVLIHGSTAILLFLVLRRMTARFWASAFAAALFAIHPQHVESVAWIAERKDVLSGLFFVLTIAAYVRYAQEDWSLSRYLLVVLMFALGLMCKPMLVTVPFVLLLLDYWPLERWPKTHGPSQQSVARGLILEKLPLLLLCVVSSLITVRVQSLQPLTSVSVTSRAANAAVAAVAYLRQLIWPVDLAAFYPFPQGNLMPLAIGSLAILVAISAAVFFLGRRYLVVGWLWYPVMILPVIGIIQVGSQARADRYTYLPHIGLYLMLTWGAAELSSIIRQRRLLLASFAAVILISLIAVARNQTSMWHDSETLWRSAIARTNDNVMAHTNLGEALYTKGQVGEAIFEYEAALQINPNYADAHSALGAAFLETGRVQESLDHLLTAVRIDPNYPEAHYNLGMAYTRTGRANEAATQYAKALELQPDYIEALNNMAFTLAATSDPSLRDPKRAVELAQRANALAGGRNARISLTLSIAYASEKRFSEAFEAANAGLQLAVAQGEAKLADALRAQIESVRTSAGR